MDIVAQQITRYSAYCSGCGAHGPHRLSAQAAALAAIDEGWAEMCIIEGTPHFYRTFCPECAAKHEKSQ